MEAWTLAVFFSVYALLAVGKLPPFRVDRTGIAIMGAAAMWIPGAISLDRALAATVLFFALQ